MQNARLDQDPFKLDGVAPQEPELDAQVLVIGAGISGIGLGIELLKQGKRSFVLLEAAEDLGGTWRDNNYPGVAVDIPSISYCFSYETDYPWSRVFAPGREVQGYIRHCAEKYAVAEHIRYRSRVQGCRFDSAKNLWEVELQGGEKLRSRFLISATGIFGRPKIPDIPGLDSFAGTTMHTARWDPAHQVHGKRVGVIGTGASAIQVVPEIARDVEKLTVFQRTPIWISPRPDKPLRHTGITAVRRFVVVRWLKRFLSEGMIEVFTFAIVNFKRLPFLVAIGELYLRMTMRGQVRDRALRAKLMPDYGLGCKRPATSNRYLRTFNRDNVELETDGIDRIDAGGVRTKSGTYHALDTLVLATGFMTTEPGSSPAFDIVGCDEVELGAYWDENRLQAYAGVAMPGFPNLFLTSGPYAGGFNWFAMLEAHLKLVVGCITRAAEEHATRVEVEPEAHAEYMSHMRTRADGTIFKDSACSAANSYYIDRHGDAALPFPHTPLWRRFRVWTRGLRGFRFS